MLVIVGHATMAFLAPDGSPSPTLWQAALDGLGAVLNTVRMPAFFVLSGAVAAHALAHGDDASFLRDRVVRLGLPLCTVLVLVNPIEVALRIMHGGLLGRWQQEPLTLPPIPVPAPGTGMQHLWYLSALLALTMMAPWLVPMVRGWLVRAGARRASVAAILVVAAPLAGVVLVRLGWRLTPHLGVLTRWQLVDPGAIAGGLGFFVTGIVLAIDDSPLRWLVSHRRLLYAIVAAGACAVLVLDPWGPAAERLPREFVAALVALPMFAMLLVGAARVGRFAPMLARYAAASYTTYLLHHVVVVATAVGAITLLGVTPLAFVLVLLTGLAVPLLLHERLVVGSAGLRFLLNGEALDASGDRISVNQT